ncbi:molybdopterin oxidoreductase family protein [Pseudomonas aeruginosa]|uniref:molybdopterin oxidoreductase family protein n=1 Tax=Pseudomonas aeruginosa TaxID=287 RepID=UPI002032B3E0|nr:molybdopterin oxidoreductase family protein [Pseudomonas aeruginosa]
MTTPSPQWKKTACILCSLNCGLEVQTENGRISKIRGDDDHPASQGYVCEKSQRMDYYQNGADRLDTPMRRRPDGSYEAIDWDTAIREVAEKFLAIKRRHGGESILYYGGGAQGNHLGGAYGDSTLKALGVKYRSNALAQEKTGEFWVQGKMFGTGVHGDFEHCEVAILIGKNPWQSHGFTRARVLLNAMAKDPARSIIVIDPRLSETAALADFHLQIRPGTDAWCLAALVGIIVQDGLLARDWLAEHTSGYEHIVDELNAIPVAYCAETCGVAEDKLRAAARRIASASSVSALEDLGMQMNLHSTLGSYLQRLVWLLTGHYGRPGTSNAFVPFLSLSKASKGDTSMGKKGAPRVEKRSPVANAKIIIGLIPCNVIPEEILTDHPKRYRAMLVETGNPLHSLADSQRMREAMRALELSVVIDVAMTETARHADYVLPAASQFEKAEATFFNLEFPRNAFHLRAPVLLYRTLGPTLPAGMEAAAAIWGICQLHVLNNRKTAARAGFDGLPPLAADRLFQAMLDNPSGVVFAETTYAESWQAIARPEQRINLHIPELLPELAKLAHSAPPHDPAYPFILAAGERRSDTSNTAVRDTGWHRRGRYGTLRISPQDAEALGCADGEVLRVVTRRGDVEAEVEISDMMQPGNISLPNGQGLDYRNAEGEVVRRGVAPNEVTDCTQRDFLAGTPWHKYVPARLERLATPAATNA